MANAPSLGLFEISLADELVIKQYGRLFFNFQEYQHHINVTVSLSADKILRKSMKLKLISSLFYNGQEISRLHNVFPY